MQTGRPAPNAWEGIMIANTAATADITVVLGDAVQARFLRKNEAIILDGALHAFSHWAAISDDGSRVGVATRHDGEVTVLTVNATDLIALATII